MLYERGWSWSRLEFWRLPLKKLIKHHQAWRNSSGTPGRRLKEIAQIVLNDFDGDLNQALKLSLPKALKALQKFPSIGAPGAEKILLFTKTYPVLALESNGLRVLLRLGFGEERKNYSASYASVQEALKDQIGDDFDFSDSRASTPAPAWKRTLPHQQSCLRDLSGKVELRLLPQEPANNRQ